MGWKLKVKKCIRCAGSGVEPIPAEGVSCIDCDGWGEIYDDGDIA